MSHRLGIVLTFMNRIFPINQVFECSCCVPRRGHVSTLKPWQLCSVSGEKVEVTFCLIWICINRQMIILKQETVFNL